MSASKTLRHHHLCLHQASRYTKNSNRYLWHSPRYGSPGYQCTATNNFCKSREAQNPLVNDKIFSLFHKLLSVSDASITSSMETISDVELFLDFLLQVCSIMFALVVLKWLVILIFSFSRKIVLKLTNLLKSQGERPESWCSSWCPRQMFCLDLYSLLMLRKILKPSLWEVLAQFSKANVVDS